MLKIFNKKKYNESELYNKILFLSRNKLFFSNLDLADTFENRVNLIFFHTAFIFIKFKKNKKNEDLDIFLQKLFDYIFKEIETNMRENGFGDTTINKNMKFLVKLFYKILLKCESFKTITSKEKNIFIFEHLLINNLSKSPINIELVDYFDKYESFCFDLSADSILQGELNFIYK
jgi:hypothetical protein